MFFLLMRQSEALKLRSFTWRFCLKQRKTSGLALKVSHGTIISFNPSSCKWRRISSSFPKKKSNSIWSQCFSFFTAWSVCIALLHTFFFHTCGILPQMKQYMKVQRSGRNIWALALKAFGVASVLSHDAELPYTVEGSSEGGFSNQPTAKLRVQRSWKSHPIGWLFIQIKLTCLSCKPAY